MLDGELVAFGADGKPDFPSLCEPMLHRHTEIPLTFLALDVLSVDGRDVRREAHRKRRRILEELGVSGMHWQTPEAFEDGKALWSAVCDHELEGVVAKRLEGRTCLVSAGGSRSRTVLTGGTSSNGRAPFATADARLREVVATEAG